MLKQNKNWKKAERKFKQISSIADRLFSSLRYCVAFESSHVEAQIYFKNRVDSPFAESNNR